jgi:hypothetical protein
MVIMYGCLFFFWIFYEEVLHISFFSGRPLIYALLTTPSILNYKSSNFFGESNISSLIKIIEKITKIYNIKYVYYKNI